MTEQERKDALRYLDASFLVGLVMCVDDQAGDSVNYSRRHKKDDGMYQEVTFVSADCAQISVGSCTCDQPCQEAVSFLCLVAHEPSPIPGNFTVGLAVDELMNQMCHADELGESFHLPDAVLQPV